MVTTKDTHTHKIIHRNAPSIFSCKVPRKLHQTGEVGTKFRRIKRREEKKRLFCAGETPGERWQRWRPQVCQWSRESILLATVENLERKVLGKCRKGQECGGREARVSPMLG